MRGPYDALLFDLYGTLVDEGGEASAGAAEALASVQSARYAIVTSCPLPIARRLLAMAGLSEPAVLVTSEDVRSGKPAPDCYLRAAQRLGARPERCLVIEDTSHGVKAALAAGMDVIAIGKEISSLRELKLEVQENGAIAVTIVPSI